MYSRNPHFLAQVLASVEKRRPIKPREQLANRQRILATWQKLYLEKYQPPSLEQVVIAVNKIVSLPPDYIRFVLLARLKTWSKYRQQLAKLSQHARQGKPAAQTGLRQLLTRITNLNSTSAV